MKTKNKILTMHGLKSQFMSWSIALFITILALAGSVLATPPENAPIWRVQLRVQTANVEDAGTDDSVRMALNLYNNTWLDYGRDDFPRNNTFTYDLKLDHVATIADLQHIYLSKTGSDGLALKSIALIVNGRTIYNQTFAGSGLWLDNSGGHSNTYVVNYTQLRQDDAWLAYTQPFPPFFIPRAEMESRIESLVGDFITGNKLQWGHLYGRAVEVSKKANTSNTLHVDLDLEYAVFGPNPEVDVDFDVEVRCVNNQLTLDIKNVKVVIDSDWYAEVFSLGIYQYIDHYVNERLSQALKGITASQSIGVPFCPVITINDDGSISFSLSRPIGVLTLANQAQATAARSSQKIADGEAPLALGVETADEITTDAETAYALLVKSNRSEAAEVNVQVELPALVTLDNTVIEVVDGNGQRLLTPQVMAGENGQALLSFNDRLEAGAENRYRLSLRFQYAPQAELQIKATVTEEGGEAAIKSTTFFQVEEGAVKARGTFQGTKAIKVAPVTSKEVDNKDRQ